MNRGRMPKATKMRSWRINNHFFKLRFVLLHGPRGKVVDAIRKRFPGLPVQEPTGAGNSWTLDRHNHPTFYVLWVGEYSTRRALTCYILAHEVTHVAFSALEDIGVKLSADNNEPMAYLVEWLTRECWKRLST